MISKRKIQNLFLLLSVLTTILMSKAYYFGVVNREIFQYIYYTTIIATGLVVGINLRKIKKAFFILIPAIVLIGINLISTSENLTADGLNQVLGIALIFICAGILGSYITTDYFAKLYINILYIICLISLPCFLIAVFKPELAMSLCQSGYNWQVPVGYSFFYTWGWNGTIFQRNSGVFWEPGAFQGFIMLAMLMLLYRVDKTTVQNRKLKFLMFILTLLTTQSTTGYILLVMLLVTQWARIQDICGNVNIVVRNIFVAAIVIGAIGIIISSGNISNKLANISTDSADIRFSDFVGGSLMVLKGGLFGLGETITRNYYRTLMGVNVNDSVGLLAMTYTYGIIFAVWYLYTMIRGIKNFFFINKKLDTLVLITIFSILHLTEGLWWLPVYVIIPIIGIVGGIPRYTN